MQEQMKTMAKFKDLSFTDKGKIIGESWGKLNTKQKQQYVDLADEDKERYLKEQNQFDKKGFFINNEGEDSRTIFKPSKVTTNVKKPQDEEMKAVERKPAKVEKVDDKPDDDIVKPKKVMSAFFCYSGQKRANLMKENPDMKITEVAKSLGESWRKLTEEEKKPFIAMQEEDRVRFEKETK